MNDIAFYCLMNSITPQDETGATPIATLTPNDIGYNLADFQILHN
jgi:hypothetical protein